MASSQPPGPHNTPNAATPPERWQSPWSLDDEWSRHPPRIVSDTRSAQPVSVPPPSKPLTPVAPASPVTPVVLPQLKEAAKPLLKAPAAPAVPPPPLPPAAPKLTTAEEELLARTKATPRPVQQTTISPKRAIPLRKETPVFPAPQPLPEPPAPAVQHASLSPPSSHTQRAPLVEPISGLVLPPVENPTTPLTPSDLGARGRKLMPPVQAFADQYRPGFSPALTGSIPDPNHPQLKKMRYHPDTERDLDDIRRAVKQGWAEHSLIWVILLGLITLTFMVVASIYMRDGPEPEDSDMVNQQQITYSGLPPRALLSFKDLLSNLPDFPHDVLLPNEEAQLWPAWKFGTPDLSKLVSHYEDSATALRNLLEESDCQPEHIDWQRTDIATSERLRLLGLARCAAAIYHARKQEYDAAFQICMELSRLSVKMQRLGLWPHFLHKGFELQHRASSTLCEVLRLMEKPDSNLLGRYQREHESLVMSTKALSLWLDQSYHMERRFLVGPRADEPMDAVTAQKLKELPGQLFFKPRFTLELFTQCFREMKKNAQQAAYLHTENRVKELGSHYQPMTWAYSSNAQGIRYANERIWPYIALVREHSQSLARHRLTQLAFALKRFQLDNARPASDLQVLIPRYFTALPADPFSPDIFSYDFGKGVLFSAGDDLTPMGGIKDGVHLAHPTEPTVMLR